MNLLTEKEAATKWCPFVRIVSQSTADPYKGLINILVDNRAFTPTGLINCNCIATQCMAWRTAKYIPVGQHSCPDCFGAECTECEGKGFINDYAEAGYCGLAREVKPC